MHSLKTCNKKWRTGQNTAQIKSTALKQTQRTRLNLFKEILSIAKDIIFQRIQQAYSPCCTFYVTDLTELVRRNVISMVITAVVGHQFWHGLVFVDSHKRQHSMTRADIFLELKERTDVTSRFC